jgi:hypothetical protein
MKLASFAVFALLISGPISAETGSQVRLGPKVADAGSACLTSCASQNDSCKRMCPTTYSGPCTSACDNQAQFCRQSCQAK